MYGDRTPATYAFCLTYISTDYRRQIVSVKARSRRAAFLAALARAKPVTALYKIKYVGSSLSGTLPRRSRPRSRPRGCGRYEP